MGRLQVGALLPVIVAACVTAACVTESGPPPKEEAPVVLTVQHSGVTSSLRGIAVLDDETVWASGSDGTVLTSSDGGASWRSVPVAGAEGLDFRDIQILGPSRLLLMSVGNGADSRIYKTDDGGGTWRAVHVNAEEKAFFNGFAFWDDARGILTSDPIDGRLYLLATDDGGESWRRVGAEGLPPLLEGEYGFAGSGTGVATAADSLAWVATGGAAARVFFSPDAGTTWEVFETPVGSGTASSGIFSLHFRDARYGVAVGGDYQDPDAERVNVALTTDGGRTWMVPSTPGGMGQKACVRYLGDGRYLAAGRTGLAWSDDEGRSWRSISDLPFYAVDYHAPSGVGWLVGPEGAVARFQVAKGIG